MISIVVPALNEERLLADCLESLRDQAYQGEYEVIVADNASTDNTVNIARRYGVKVVPCPQRKSVFYARQVGANAASGEIIVQADADTVYPRGWLKRIADQFAAHPEVVAVAGRFVYRDPTVWAKAEYWFRNMINRLTLALSGKPLLVSGATFAFRRSAFLAVSGYEGLAYSADQYGIATRLSQTGKVLYDQALYVLTSSRSVRKPTAVLAAAVLANIGRLGMYYVKSWGTGISLYVHQTRSRRIAAGLVPGGMIIVMLASYGYFVPASPVFGKVYAKGTSTEKVVALTFDDGPNEPYTSEILDILRSHNINATFFTIGQNVELYPETANRIVAEGNVIGNHSYTHSANHALSLYGSRDLERAQLAILQTVGVSPHLYRAPHGRKSPWELYYASKAGLIEVAWTVSTPELHTKSATSVAQRILSKTDSGEIILLHDGYGTSHDTAKADKSLTVQALPLIIDQLQAKGYKFVTVPQLLGVPAYNN